MLRCCNSRCHICDAGNSEYLHTKIIGRNRLRHCGHSDSIRPKSFIRPNLCRRLIAGTGKNGIDAFLISNVKLLSRPLRLFNQLPGVSLRHIWEPNAETLVIFPDQRILSEHIDVIRENHQISRRKAAVNAAAGVGHNQALNAEKLHHIHRIGNFLHLKALIVVESSLQGCYYLCSNPSDHQISCMACYMGLRKAGNILIWDNHLILHDIHQASQSASQNNADGRSFLASAFYILC